MKYILFFLLSTSYLFSLGQTQLWMDDFETTAGDWDLTLQAGPNDTEANIWVISDEEGGVTPPGCGTASNGNKTLHVGCQGAMCMAAGAAYNAGDDGLGFSPAATNIRAALTTPISTQGETQLEVVFDWIGVGQNGQDFAELEYSVDGGTTWNVIWTQTPGATCGGGQGEWKEEVVALPAAAENQADLRFAFHWVNDNDGDGADPSFAANDLRLNTLAAGNNPIADFTTASLTICETDCIDFTDASTGTNISNWDWTFNGADTPNSSDQNPTGICYSSAGTYDVTLSVTDDNGTNDVTYQILVLNCSDDPPSAAFTTDSLAICAGECIDFTDESTNNPDTWEWNFDGATPPTSTEQNPSNICFDLPGTYGITLIVKNDAGSDTIVTPLTVMELPTVQGIGDTIIDLGGAAKLEATLDQPGNIFWEPTENLDCSNCDSVFATPTITTEYYPSVVGANGCIGRDTVTVYIAFEENIGVPDIFSPNGDGQNDLLRVLGNGIEKMTFKIYNRYGQLVFSTSDLNEGWDGTMNGEPLNQGVFVYTLTYTLIDGTRSDRTGNVTLVK